MQKDGCPPVGQTDGEETDNEAAEPLEKWQRPPSAKDAAQLDLDLIAELNADTSLLEEKPRPKKHFWSIVALLLAITILCGFIFAVYGKLKENDLGFLQENVQLAQDPFVQSLKGAILGVQCKDARGTAFSIRSDGLALTNYHVVQSAKNAGDIILSLQDGKLAICTSYLLYPELDLAVLSFSAQNLSYVQISLEEPKKGDLLYFVGNPLGFSLQAGRGKVLRHTVSEGIQPPVLLFSGLVNSGNSGSPVFNEDGQAVAVIFAKLSNVKATGLAIELKYLFEKEDFLQIFAQS